MSRRSESTNVITSLFKIMVSTLASHADPYLYSRMRIGTNAETRKAANVNTTDPDIELPDSAKKVNPKPNLERLSRLQLEDSRRTLRYASAKQLRTAFSRSEQTPYVTEESKIGMGSYEKEERADGEEIWTHDWYNTVDARAGRPCKPEQTTEDEKNADDDDGHALLLLELTLFVTLWLLDVMEVRKEEAE